ncbi:hypothetical protein LVD17_13830 [Fulvivirga ulvae]|uniref:RHS repeat-associated core domain-containing protein n=1 Tax=Fulvivirga ulvae TaxID=2904245 RepID=UPI001F2EE17D|nr:RHS repeat-associated core domain-containing protein [Fulvivirga ulvae]UII34887.1 hypothetical protein LVD17_13830 [Fulvivirga ulvae]
MNNLNKYILIFLLFTGYNSYGQNPITWTDLVGVEIQPDNTLLKTAGWGTDNGGAASAEILQAGTDGWAEFTVYPTGYERYFGLTQNNVDAAKNMDYAIKISSINTIVVQESGVSRGGFGSISAGEVLRVERTGTTIEYKRDGSTFHTSQVPSTTTLRVDVSLYHSNGEIRNGTLNFGAAHVEAPNAPTALQSTTVTSNSAGLQWADNASDETGFIIERQSGTGTYEQVANLPSNTTSYTDGTVAGAVSYTYRVYAYNPGGNSSYSNALTVTTSSTAREGFPVTWTDLTGVEILADNTLRKIAGWGTDNGGATSVEILPAGTDGWAEFIVYATGHERYFGLTGNSTDATSNIDYAFKISSTNGLVAAEKGQNQRGLGHIKDGDILRIKRAGTSIEYIKNDTTYYTSEVPSAGPLMVDVSIYHTSGEIRGSAISFEAMVAPEIPAGVQAIATDFDKNLITWAAQDPAISYEIERSLSETGGFARVAATVRGAGQYKDSKLTGGTTYYYRVRATNGQEFSAYSNVVSSTTKTAVATENTLAHKPQYNGNISAIKWKAHGDAEEKLYTYSYDAMNRIKTAQYAQGHTQTNKSWVTGSAQGGYSVNNINYDLNGNIQSLNRQSIEEDLRTIDALTYSYAKGGNQLTAVSDAAGWEGFADKNTVGDDYEYDANGNMTRDKNKGVTITYNHLNLPVRVEKDANNYILYRYDATGVKQEQVVYEEGKEPKSTRYFGELIYEDGELTMIQHEEGRVVIDEITGGFEYQYHLRDHLGNTRLTFTTKPKVIDFPARFETETSAEEEQLYSGINNTRVKFPSADAANSDINVAGDDEVIGLNNQISAGAALSIPVGPGDELDMQVYGYYEAGDYGGLQTGNAVLMAVAGAFGGANGGNTYEQSTYDAFSRADGAGMLVSGNDAGDARPAAYLNYILFDEQMNPYKFGHAQIEGTANSHELVALNDVVVDKAGFAYIYLSNESDSPLPVFFDDMKVVVTESNVLETSDYYPYGLQIAGGFKRVTAKENRFKFNGFELQTGLDWGVYDYKARHYDPVLGRFLNVDPAADLMRRHSPYNYAFDNPIRFIDPDGMLPEETGKGPCGDKPCPEDNRRAGQKFADGIGNGLVRTGEAFEKFLDDPVAVLDQAEAAVKGFLKDPKGTLDGVASGVENTLVEASNDPEKAGELVFDVALIVATDGLARQLGFGDDVMKGLQTEVNTTASAMQKTGQAPATVVGASLPNGATKIARSAGPPTIIAPSLEKAANELGGVGTKRAGNTIGCCGEFRAGNELLLENPYYKPSDIQFTPAIRPRTGQVITPCQNCQDIFNIKQ